MATNKVVYGNRTLIDLTSDTADVSDVIQGKTFHSADGTQKTGTRPSGGQMVETVLWTNPNPSVATGFAAQAASLSDDINNYEWIAVEYARGYNILSDTNKVYWKVSDFKTFITTANRMCGCLTLVNNNRTFYYDNDTQAHFGHNIVGGTATNTLNIPLYIYGCKIN